MSQRLERTCVCERKELIRFEAEDASAWRPSAPCPAAGCGRHVPLARDASLAQDGLHACLACGHRELYTRKDFPPAIGISIVIVAALLVPFTPYYSSLIVAAAVDALLYRFAPDVVVCYVCLAEHRGFARKPRHPRFDRTIEERLLYGERAVMGSPMRPEGTADAPEPEH